MPAKSTPAHTAFRRALLRWFRRHGRDLPWRRTRDPYRVLVSEFMLQQTQVSRVEAYYHRFLKCYPTIHALADAPAAAVRESWDGLGYYRRAENLHRLAQAVVKERSGVIPREPEQLVELPGVGRYTAGAVACFAYERGVAAVDTNVARVLRRAFHPRTDKQRLFWKTAARLVPRRGGAAWAFNQAIMELGALVCTAREPRCGACPVRTACKTGRVRAAIPRAAPPGRETRKQRPRSASET
ncbi:MAG TPA: A/G-specific adenine glycosylase [Gemmatimonadales bacterium]|jgi:A/G-specific adenine glycosylase|nr:A/G-specific adenine glycosylase [Gemmatimonadales bacterium]